MIPQIKPKTKSTVDWGVELANIPDHWALTPVREKRPLRPSWQSEQPIDRAILLQLLRDGQYLEGSDGKPWLCAWTGIGLRLGEPSNGLLAIDVDGPNALTELLRICNNQLPETVSWTSGKEGRQQLLFQMPDDVHVVSSRIACNGDYLEFRWTGEQSVLPPSLHPDTGKYRWLTPPTHPVASAPEWLLEIVAKEKSFLSPPPAQPELSRLLSAPAKPSDMSRPENHWSDLDWAISYMEALDYYRADDYEDWITVGMALHSVGEESLFHLWDRWSSYSPKYREGECEKKWRGFKPDGQVTIKTLCYLAKQDGWVNPFQKTTLPSGSPAGVTPKGKEREGNDEFPNCQPSYQSYQATKLSTPKNLPPSLIDAETELLRLMLLGLCKELDVFGIITTAEVFYDPKHGLVYESMLDLHVKGLPANYVSVLDHLQSSGNLSRIGGKPYMLALTDNEHSFLRGENAESCAKMLVDKWVRRKTIANSEVLYQLGFDQTLSLDDLLDQAEKSVYSLRLLTPNKTTLHNKEVSRQTFEKLHNPNQIYATGFASLDKLLIGLEAETLTVLAARSSMGKTAFAVQLLLQMSVLHKKHCAYFSLEMTAEQLEHRIWTLVSNHSYFQEYNLNPLHANRLRSHMGGANPLTSDEEGNIAAIASLAADLNMSINDSRNITPSGIGSECRKLRSHYGELGCIFIDYLQLFGGDSGNAAETSNKLLGVTRYFYNLAQELKCPVVLLAQISRGAESRNDKRPCMSDLAQSGGVEWIADNILMLYRPGYYSSENPDDPELEVICRKARQGATGTANLSFDRERLYIYED